MSEQLSREQIEMIRARQPIGIALSDLNALCDMAAAQAEQTKAVPQVTFQVGFPTPKEEAEHQAVVDESRRLLTEAGLRAANPVPHATGTAPAPSEGLVERLRERARDLRLDDKEKFSPELMEEAALALRREAEDAARYRWLREHMNYEDERRSTAEVHHAPDALTWRVRCWKHDSNDFTAKTLDAAIDAARRES